MKTQILIVAVLVAGFLFTYKVILRAEKDAAGTVIEKIKAGALIVDVRTPEEFASGHYKNAMNIPLDQISSRIKEFGNRDKPVIVYCRSGNRSRQAKKILIENGFKDVTNGGGLNDMPK